MAFRCRGSLDGGLTSKIDLMFPLNSMEFDGTHIMEVNGISRSLLEYNGIYWDHMGFSVGFAKLYSILCVYICICNNSKLFGLSKKGGLTPP